MNLEGVLDGILNEAHEEVRQVNSILGDRVGDSGTTSTHWCTILTIAEWQI